MLWRVAFVNASAKFYSDLMYEPFFYFETLIRVFYSLEINNKYFPVVVVALVRISKRISPYVKIFNTIGRPRISPMSCLRENFISKPSAKYKTSTPRMDILNIFSLLEDQKIGRQEFDSSAKKMM